MLEIHITKKTQEDLENIWIYSFKEWGEKQADKYFDTLDQAINKTLLNNPKTGSNCNHISSGYRLYKVAKHLIFYKLTQKRILIIRILHHRINVRRHLNYN